jgi:uncharacterized protein YbjT (DUF2867 family)
MTGKILVVGATSGIGACVVKNAAGRGLVVRAFARSAGDMKPEDGIEPFAGDARKPEDVRKALDGVDAVILTLGIKERLAMLWEEETLFSDATRVILSEMQDLAVKRLVAVTGFGAGRSKPAMSFVERLGHRAILGKPYADKDRQEALITASDLDWTIVRPVILTNGSAKGKIKVLRDPKTWRNGLISRAQVAQYLVDIVGSAQDVRADVVIAR